MPFDVHSAAQSLITLVELRGLRQDSLDLAQKVLNWTFENLRDPDGFFYYQKRSSGCVKIPYMRWGQAWMLLALATVLETQAEEEKVSAITDTAQNLALSAALK